MRCKGNVFLFKLQIFLTILLDMSGFSSNFTAQLTQKTLKKQ